MTSTIFFLEPGARRIACVPGTWNWQVLNCNGEIVGYGYAPTRRKAQNALRRQFPNL